MAAGITNKDGAAYSGAIPWHRLGVMVDAETTTGKEMLTLAGANWGLRVLKPTYALDPSDPEKSYKVGAGQWRVVVRDDTYDVLGQVADGYEPFTNAEAIEFTDSLLADGIMRYTAVFTLWGGRHMVAQALMGQGYEILGERYEDYLAIMIGHDGKTGIRLFPTSTRIVCSNMLNLALGAVRGKFNKAGKPYYSIAHIPGMRRQLETAQRALQISTEQSRKMRTLLESATEVTVTQAHLNELRHELFGDTEETDKEGRYKVSGQKRKLAEAWDNILAEERQRNGDRAYSVIQAITGFADHAMKARTPERAWESVYAGRSYSFKQEGIALLQEITGQTLALAA